MPITTGTGESGKSTVVKQFRLATGDGIPEIERRDQRSFIYGQLVNSMKALINGAEALGIGLVNKVAVQDVSDYNFN